MKQNLKFRTKSPEHSEAIQKRLFDLGYSWAYRVQKESWVEAKYIYANSDSVIRCNESKPYFDKHENKESTLDELYELKKDSTMEIVTDEPESGQFIKIWEYQGEVWSETVRWKGPTREIYDSNSDEWVHYSCGNYTNIKYVILK